MSSLSVLKVSSTHAVLSNAFDTNYSNALKFLSQRYDEGIEIEARLTEYSDHCPLDRWHSFDSRLTLITDVYDDYVQSIEHPTMSIPFTRFRRYLYGGAIQAKYSICKFTTSGHSSSVPLLFRISKESELTSLGEIENCVHNTQRLFRQSFMIKPIESLPLLTNWRVDKSVRYFMDGEQTHIPVPADSTIDHPIGYSLLDIEFEYLSTAPRDKLAESTAQLIEFINGVIHPQLYHSFSSSFILFEKLISINFNERFFSRDKLFGEMVILNRNSIDDNPVTISMISRRCVLVILSENNRIVIYEDEIDLSEFKGFGGELFHIVYCFTHDERFVPIDISVHESRVINRLSLVERMNRLSDVRSKHQELFTSCENGETVIHRTDECNSIRYLPSEYVISFKLAMKKDECEYHLLDSNDIPFASPFIFSHSFSPLIGRSDFEDAMSHCLSLFDGKVVDFKIRVSDSRMEILPFQFGTAAVNSIEAIHVMFRAYYSWAISEGKIVGEMEQQETTIIDVILQAAIERLLARDLKSAIAHRSTTAIDYLANLCVYSPSYAVESPHLLYIASLTANSENLIIHGSPSSVISNLDEYYSTTHNSRPIFNSLNMTGVPNVVAIDERLNISSVGEFFDNSMNGIATPFLQLTARSLIDLYRYILRNKTVRTIVVLNIIDGVMLTHVGEGGENLNDQAELPFSCRLRADEFIDEYNSQRRERFNHELLQRLAILFNLSVHVNANPFEAVCEIYYSDRAIDREFGAIVDHYSSFKDQGVLFTKEELNREDIHFVIQQARDGWIVVVTNSPIHLTSVKRVEQLSSDSDEVFVYSSVKMKTPRDAISRYIIGWLMQQGNSSVSKLIEEIGSIIHYKTERRTMIEDQDFRSILERDLLLRRKYMDKTKEIDLSKLVSIKLIF